MDYMDDKKQKDEEKKLKDKEKDKEKDMDKSTDFFKDFYSSDRTRVVPLNNASLSTMSKSLPPGPKKGETLKQHEKETGIKNAKKTMPKEYKQGGADTKKEYADPKNNKYPIDTPEHVRAAAAYFSKPKNYGMYEPGERKAMWSRIRGAAKKHGVEVSSPAAPGSKKDLDKGMMISTLDHAAKLLEAFAGRLNGGM